MAASKGIVIYNNKVFEMDFPVETYIVAVAWGQDMICAINDFGKIRKFILRMIMGRYAWREMIGLRDSIEKYGYGTNHGYSLENLDYHKDKVKL